MYYVLILMQSRKACVPRSHLLKLVVNKGRPTYTWKTPLRTILNMKKPTTTLHIYLLFIFSNFMPLQHTTKMAQILNLPLLFLTLALALSFTVSLLPHNVVAASYEFSTNVLEVKASLNQAHQVLSFKPKTQTLQQNTQPAPTSSPPPSFSLPLHPRDSLLNHHHNDYRSLLLSRLHHDSARVNSIITKFKCQFNNSDLYPIVNSVRPKDLSAPITACSSQGSGDYIARIGVGQPVQQFYMTIDISSEENWLQCKPCSHCYQQPDPIFDPSKSSSYAPLTCEATQCHDLETTSCRNNTCHYKISYGSAFSTEGDFITETVSFGSTRSVNQVAMGCGHDNQGKLTGSAGNLGLGRGPMSLTSQIKASTFSYCLVDHDSLRSSTLEFNSSGPDDSVTTQLLKNPKLSNLQSFYYAGFTGVSVGGKNIIVPKSTFMFDQIGLGGMVVDTETVVTRLQTEAYNSVRDVFVSFTQNLKRASNPVFDTCYNFSGLGTVVVPTVSFQVSDGKSWTLPTKNYLIPVDKNGTFCFAIAPLDLPLSILGNLKIPSIRFVLELLSQ